MLKRKAIGVMAYGTDPTGQGPSPMMREVVRKAWQIGESDPEVLAYILQGGYSYNNGPMEAVLMGQMFAGETSRDILTEIHSMNTIEGAQAMLSIADAKGFDELILVAESFHAWRVWYTFRHLAKSYGIKTSVVTVNTVFGGNSQKRLNSAWRWWPWDIAARIVTAAKLFLADAREH